jgi:hypothetical protein
VKITVISAAEIRIRIASLSPGSEWSFLNAYAGVLGLGERVEQFHAFAPGGGDLGAKKIAPGEFRSGPGAETIEYVVRLPPARASEAGHVSWISGESGFLMLADLLPKPLPSVMLGLSLPSGWHAYSTYEADPQGRFHVLQPDRTVFLIGRGVRKQTKRFDSGLIDCVVDGSWPFRDAIVLNAAMKVLKNYIALTRFPLRAKPTVMLASLPAGAGSVKWRAETRGSTVVLLIDPQAKIQNWAGELGIIFTHELLHLWVPNSLLLEGDYDWFFEGFTLYTALVTALELKFINFNEYVATIARVYDSYLSRPDDLSLIDASERRWTSGGPTVYDKGMLVAFVYDLALARESAGKMRLADRYRQLFQRWATQPANANEVIIQLLSSTAAGADLTKRYIEGRQELDIKQTLADRNQLSKSLGYR